MKRDEFVENVLHDGDKRLPAALLRGLLTPLAGLHQAGLEAYLLPYRTGIRKQARLPVPVIAIGNLSSGGTGKTPMAALVARYLQSTGRRVVLLSRGHGGNNENRTSARIVSNGQTVLLDPETAGDEPVLLAQLLPGVPVVVGRDRRVSGKMACETFAPDVLVCDDALQFWQLYRNLNIVLLDARRPWDNGHLLPRGLLREPPRHLSRAGIVVLTRADQATSEQIEKTKSQISRYAPQASVFSATHQPQNWVCVGDAQEAASGPVLPLPYLHGKAAFVFSGIADHAAFAKMVQAQNVQKTGERVFADHHAYTPEEIADVLTAARASGAGVLITTEKDAVKIGRLLTNTGQNGLPTYALRVGMNVNDEVAFFARIDAALTPVF